ncbi:hypothetical protein C8R43DRAFT_1124613 [Mycena crocata]|nr:hypothetical protein C8R43DRAFT_1124613 [Mycena crocata]
MSTFQNSKSGLRWTLGPKAPSGVLLRGASPGGFCKTAESSPTYEVIGTVAQAGAGMFPILRTTAEVARIEVGSPRLTSGLIMPGKDSPRAGCGAWGLPQDTKIPFAAALCVEEGPAQRAQFWAAASTTASSVSLALSLTTGSAGSLPKFSRTPPIPIGVVLAQPRQGAWLFWLHTALLLACAAGLVASNWRPTLFREHTMSLAGAHLFPGMSCSCAVPFSDRVYRLATCSDLPHVCAMSASSGSTAVHSGPSAGGSQRNGSKCGGTSTSGGEDGRVVTEAKFHAREPYRVP